MFGGRLKVKDAELQDVNEVVGQKSAVVWVILQLLETFAAHCIDTSWWWGVVVSGYEWWMKRGLCEWCV